MTFEEVIRAAIPNATADDCNYILWNRTGFPGFWRDKNIAREVFKAARRTARAALNHRRLCDFCDRVAMENEWLCSSCHRELKKYNDL